MIKDGKIFGKINIIDFLVIVLILILILGAYLKFGIFGKNNNLNKTTVIEYDIKVPVVRKFTIDAIKVGDEIYDSQTGNSMGKVTSINYNNAEQSLVKEDGTIVMASMKDKYDLVVTVETDGTENKVGFYAKGNIELKVGGDKDIETKYIKCMGTIFRIETKD
jgi:hypothetical protein